MYQFTSGLRLCNYYWRGVHYETKRQGVIIVFSETPQIVSTLCSAYKALPSKKPHNISHGLLQHISLMLRRVDSTSFHLFLLICTFFIFHQPFLFLWSVSCWFGWSPDMDLRCKWERGECSSVWTERWAYFCMLQAVWTLLILYSLLASRLSHRTSQPGSDLTVHLQNTSIPKA